MLRSLKLEPDKCTGCLQCEMACSYENEGVFNPAKSRIKVFTFHHEGRFAPYTCTQCAEAWCQKACPVEAIQIDQAVQRIPVEMGGMRVTGDSRFLHECHPSVPSLPLRGERSRSIATIEVAVCLG